MATPAPSPDVPLMLAPNKVNPVWWEWWSNNGGGGGGGGSSGGRSYIDMVLDMKADNSGVADCSTLFLAALGKANFYGVHVHFPAGKYTFNSAVVCNYALTQHYGVKVTGSGGANTIIYSALSGNVWPFNFKNYYQTITVEHLSFECGSTNVAKGIALTNTSPLGSFLPSVFYGVSFYGSGGQPRFNTCIEITNVSGCYFFGCNFYGGFRADSAPGSPKFGGIGVRFQGSTNTGDLSDPNYSIYNNMVSCVFNSLGVGVYLGNQCQGITISGGCNFQNTMIGVYGLAGALGILQVQIIGNQFDCIEHPILIQAFIGYITVTDNWIAIGEGKSVNLGTCNYVNVKGNFITGRGAGFGGAGIELDGDGGVIANNTIGFVGSGITLYSNSEQNRIDANVFLGVTSLVTNAGTGNVITS